MSRVTAPLTESFPGVSAPGTISTIGPLRERTIFDMTEEELDAFVETRLGQRRHGLRQAFGGAGSVWQRALMEPLGSFVVAPGTFGVLISGGELHSFVTTAGSLHVFPEIDQLSDTVEIPEEVGKRHEPVIRGKGVPVWVLVAYAEKRGMTPEEISRMWKGYVTSQEVRAALAYWRAHPEAVEDKLD